MSRRCLSIQCTGAHTHSDRNLAYPALVRSPTRPWLLLYTPWLLGGNLLSPYSIFFKSFCIPKNMCFWSSTCVTLLHGVTALCNLSWHPPCFYCAFDNKRLITYLESVQKQQKYLNYTCDVPLDMSFLIVSFFSNLHL